MLATWPLTPLVCAVPDLLGLVDLYFIEYHLIPFFQNYGYILDIKLQADKGFAFIRLDTNERAAMAIQALHGAIVNGRPIKCSWGRDRPLPTGPGGTIQPLNTAPPIYALQAAAAAQGQAMQMQMQGMYPPGQGAPAPYGNGAAQQGLLPDPSAMAAFASYYQQQQQQQQHQQHDRNSYPHPVDIHSAYGADDQNQ